MTTITTLTREQYESCQAGSLRPDQLADGDMVRCYHRHDDGTGRIWSARITSLSPYAPKPGHQVIHFTLELGHQIICVAGPDGQLLGHPVPFGYFLPIEQDQPSALDDRVMAILG